MVPYPADVGRIRAKALVFSALVLVAGLAGGSHDVASAEVTTVRTGQVPPSAYVGMASADGARPPQVGASSPTRRVVASDGADTTGGGVMGQVRDMNLEALSGPGLIALGAGLTVVALGWRRLQACYPSSSYPSSSYQSSSRSAR